MAPDETLQALRKEVSELGTAMALPLGDEIKGVFDTCVARKYHCSGVPYTESQWYQRGYPKSEWEAAKRCRLRCDPHTNEKESIDTFVKRYGGTLWRPPLEWTRAFEPKRNGDGRNPRFPPVVGWAHKNNLSNLADFLVSKGCRDLPELGKMSRVDVDALLADSSFHEDTKASFFLAIHDLKWQQLTTKATDKTTTGEDATYVH